jgi:hypothetical protein
MDFFKRTFEHIMEIGNKTRKEVYLKFTDNKDKRIPLMSSHCPLVTCSNTQPLTPISAVMEPIRDSDDRQLQERSRALRSILGPTVPELTIQQLIQNYNSVEAALNGYLDNLQNYQISSSVA